MRKKQSILLWFIIAVVVIATICFIITIGKNNDTRIQEVSVDETGGVTMAIKEGTLTKSGVTILIQLTDEEEKNYGEWFRIDKKENGEWRGLETADENYVFDAIGYILKPSKQSEEKIDWRELYGELERGEYRLVKNISGKYIGVEFTIE